MNTRAVLDALRDPSANLGLASGQGSLAESSPRWPALFSTVANHLETAFAGVPVEIAHIGSTSVPGLLAKPVLDIAIGAHEPIDIHDMIQRLESVGFAFSADLGPYGGLFFLASTESGLTLAHVHVVDIADFQWQWYLAFRDGLRSDAILRREYTDLKRAAADSHPDDRQAYTTAKVEWVLTTINGLVEAASDKADSASAQTS